MLTLDSVNTKSRAVRLAGPYSFFAGLQTFPVLRFAEASLKFLDSVFITMIGSPCSETFAKNKTACFRL